MPRNSTTDKPDGEYNLSEYNLKLIHVPGRHMVQSDVLSRHPDLCPDEESINEERILLPETLFVNVIDTKLQEAISKIRQQDTVVADTLKALQTGEPLPMKSVKTDWKIDNDLILYKDKCYVPNDLELRRKIVQKYHDTLPMGHPGQLRTQELVQQDYWWPGLAVFVKNYVTGCAICQQHKINRHPTNPPLQPIRSENTRPFSLTTMDFITDLPKSDGFDSIMVMVDHGSSKGVILEPCHKTIDAASTGNILLNSLYQRYGLPDKMISDRD